MKIKYRLILLALFLCAFLVGCNTGAKALEDAGDFYQKAVTLLDSADAYTLTAYSNQTIIHGSQTFSYTSSKSVSYWGLNTDQPSAASEEYLYCGSYNAHFTEVYQENMMYLLIDDAVFGTPISAEQYMMRQPPAKLLDINIYKNITAEKNSNGYTVSFSQPLSAESWAVTADCTLIDANGKAHINQEGQLTAFDYTVSYKIGEAEIHQQHKISIKYEAKASVPAFDKTDLCILSDADAIKLLELCSGYLTQASNIQSTIEERIDCEAGGVNRAEITDLYICGTDQTVQTQIEITDYTDAENKTVYKQEEAFTEGKYSIAVNNKQSEPADHVSAQQMEQYCRDKLVSSLFLPEHIVNATISRENGMLILSFTGNTELSQAICDDACSKLYQDPDMLHNMSASYTANSITGYLYLDEHTLLPYSSGYVYTGSHTIENHAYELSVNFDQHYTFN